VRVKKFWLRACVVLVAAAMYPVAAMADQSSEPGSPAAGHISAGGEHSCAILATAARCWGFSAHRQLGYGTTASIGDDETPGSVGPIDFGPGRTAQAISAGFGHTCALLDDATVRCWGFGGDGRLGYVSVNDTPAGQSPGDAPAVDIGGPAKAITAGESHTCAILVDGSVRCWGYGGAGQLGYGNPAMEAEVPNVGDDETPASQGPVNLGAGRTAVAISAGGAHTCAILDDGTVRCWGNNLQGAIGTGTPAAVGDNETPDAVPPVNIGAGRTAIAIDAGFQHTCVVLDDKTVRCWGNGFDGQLGLGTMRIIGDTESPGDFGPVSLGGNARAISAGRAHTCAVMESGALRCWGRNHLGQLGLAHVSSIGDDELPTAAPAVDVGPGRTAVAVAAGTYHTCSLLDDASVRCWGFGTAGRLGYCNQRTIGDTELPSSVAPVDLGPSGAGCAGPVVVPPPVVVQPPPPPPDPIVTPPGPAVPATSAPDPRAEEAARRRALRSCQRTASRRAKRLRSAARRACLRRYGRTPGRVTRLRARASGRTTVVLTFNAPGSDGRREPAARSYLVRQSLRPMRTPRQFSRGQSLCRGSCRFTTASVGARMTLTVTGLRPRTTYYYSVAARDNVSNRLGPRAPTVRVRTR
jgi:alpha-tubulin suppressor-like RCC1 family protein